MSTPAAATARPRGPGRSFLGLVWALVPVLLLLVLLVRWQQGGASPVPSVDPRPDIAYAKRVSPVPLPAPGPLPGQWRATSSRVDAPAGEQKRSPVTLTIGYLTGEDKFAEVVIGDRAPAALVAEAAAGATRDGTAPVGGTGWDRYRTARGETVLVHQVGRAGVLVTGDAPVEDLAVLAAAVG